MYLVFNVIYVIHLTVVRDSCKSMFGSIIRLPISFVLYVDLELQSYKLNA
jgi:hypothetical protein